MSGRGPSPNLEVELNLLSPPLRPSSPDDDDDDDEVWAWNNNSPSEMSSELSVVESSSCVSSVSSPETAPSMVLVGCRRCLMYVLLSEVDPKCPKCNSKVLLDFLNVEEATKSTTAGNI